jgi:hypothetical protein
MFTRKGADDVQAFRQAAHHFTPHVDCAAVSLRLGSASHGLSLF